MYKVLSLKWRPQTFAQIIGQKAVCQTLCQALESNTLHQALIFAGPKGTGKTSTARVLAKALRCEKRKGPGNSPEPCGECSSCESIKEGFDMDVLEIDGASNSSVEMIRGLKDSVQYMPSSGKVRVFIIDEVHSLSTSAFNALLKTLEEPPSHVYFILATTELRKVPAPAASRCQVFHFRPIESPLIQKKLQEIAKAENISIEEEALWMITEQSQNSMRDAQVLLDQMARLGEGGIKAEDIEESLGLTSRSLIDSILEDIIKKDTESILSKLSRLSSSSAFLFLKSLLFQIRNLLLIKLMKEPPPQVLFLMESHKKELKKMAEQISSQELHQLFDMGLQSLEDIKKSFDPQITLEMALIRMTGRQTSKKMTAPLSLDRERGVGGIGLKEKALTEENIESLITFIQKKDPKTAAHLKSFSITSPAPGALSFSYSKSHSFLEQKSKNPAFRKKIELYLKEFFKQKIECRFTEGKTESLRRKQEKKKQDQQRENINAHPVAQKLSQVFGAELSPDRQSEV